MPPRLGLIRTAPQALSEVRSNAGPESFGAGIGVALRGLGADIQQMVEYQQQEEQYLAATAYTKWAGEQQRALLEAQQEVEPGAPDFTNQYHAALRQNADEFLATLSPQMQKRFAPQVEGVVQGVTSGAFAFERTARKEFAGHNLDIAANDAAIAIHNDPSLIEAMADDLAVLVMTNPDFTEQEKLAMLEVYDKTLKRALILGRVRDGQILIEGQIGAADGSDIVAPGMPGVARGLANATASVETINGRYDITYQNAKGDGSIITDFSDHPRRYIEITEGPFKGQRSSAAGRYQITASTWDEYAPKAGVTDFTPASQDKVFWEIAKDRYHRETGRDLVTDLNGDRETVKAVRSALLGTWPGLANIDDDAFANAILGSKGLRGPQPSTEYTQVYAPEDIWDDPDITASFTFDEMNELYLTATRTAEARNQEQAQARKAEYDAKLNNLRNQIIDGTAGMPEIQRAEQSWLGVASDRMLVRNMLEKQQTDATAWRRVEAATANPGTDNFINAEDRKDLNTWYNYKPAEGQSARDTVHNPETREQWAAEEFLPLVDATQAIPTDTIAHFKQIRRTGSFEDVSFVLGTYSELRKRAPDVAQEYLDEDDYRAVMLFEAFGQNGQMKPEEFMARIRRRFDPAMRAQRDADLDAAQSLVRKQKTDGEWRTTVQRKLDPGIFVSEPSIPLKSDVQAGFLRDYELLFEEGMMDFLGDEDKAHDYAKTFMMRKWSPTTIGGTNRWAWLAPETFYPKNGRQGLDWIEPQARADLGAFGENFLLIADDTTRREHEAYMTAQRAGLPLPPLPSYLVFRDDMTPWDRDADGNFVRWHGELNEGMEEEQKRFDEISHLDGQKAWLRRSILEDRQKLSVWPNQLQEDERAALTARMRENEKKLEETELRQEQLRGRAAPGARGEEVIP